MLVYKRFSPSIYSAFWVVIMITLWLAFAPMQAGGMASYIIVIGNSMEPGFHIGDLVIAHPESTYQVGEAVVYRNLELGRFVFHRIIAQDKRRFVLKGDNNPWTDTYQPTHEEVLGRLWLRIPQGGRYIQKIRNPVIMALIAGIFGGILAISLILGKSKGNRRMEKKSIQEWFASTKRKTQGWLARENRSEPSRPLNSDEGNLLEGLFFGLGFVALVSLILVIISFSQPSSRKEVNDIDYNHLGFFSYSASAPQGVYDSNTLKSGDPIFPRLTCSVSVNFQYLLMAQQAENIAGTHQLTAVVSEPASGWVRIVPLQNESPFIGNTFDTTASLNLCQVETLIQSMEQGADFHSASYLLTVIPNIKLKGNISGRPLESTFNSGLNFRYDRVHFSLVKDEEKGNPLNGTESGVLHEERPAANTMLLLGMKVEIPALRWIALLGLIVSLTVMALVAMRVQNLSRIAPGEFIRLRYQALMIEVQNPASIDSSNTIEVASIDDLAKLAERFNSMILHVTEGNLHTYYVQGTGITYRFAMAATTNQLVTAVGTRPADVNREEAGLQ